MNNLISINGSDLKYMVGKVLNEVAAKRGKLNEEDEKSYEAIGFASKFYTLWYITERIERTKYGVYEKTLCQFVKSISTDLEKAKAKYPDAVFIPGLRGHTSFERTRRIRAATGPDEFKSGKYAGQKVTDCQDYSYLAYVLDNCPYILPDGFQEVVEGMLTDAGYIITHHTYEYSGGEYLTIRTPEDVKRFEQLHEEADELIAQLETGSINVMAAGNLSDEGVLSDPERGTIIKYQFPKDKYKVLFYNGYGYGLPVDAKGVGKKIKGKMLTIIPEDYEIENEDFGDGLTIPHIKVIVKDFKIN